MLPNTIIISDLHAPYQHPDALEFLATIKDQYDIKAAKNVGDVVDNHFPSFHEVEYGCLSNKEEYETARTILQELSDIYPDMDVSMGNHDIIPERKAKLVGIPEDCIVDFNKRYGVNWNCKQKHYFKIDKNNNCLLIHNLTANTMSNARNYSHCSLQGHHHSLFGIEYFADHETLRWSMSVGCLIDTKSPAFNYVRGQILKRPILGCGVIIDGLPVLIPMRLKRNHRWDGSV